jgi:hypothetical protein
MVAVQYRTLELEQLIGDGRSSAAGWLLRETMLLPLLHVCCTLRCAVAALYMTCALLVHAWSQHIAVDGVDSHGSRIHKAHQLCVCITASSDAAQSMYIARITPACGHAFYASQVHGVQNVEVQLLLLVCPDTVGVQVPGDHDGRGCACATNGGM